MNDSLDRFGWYSINSYKERKFTDNVQLIQSNASI